jgi:uncharacterized protein (TIGR02757 family)
LPNLTLRDCTVSLRCRRADGWIDGGEMMSVGISKSQLEELYRRFTLREFVHPDPLEFLYAYPALRDREVVGLVASSLAYGRVLQILRSVSGVLERIGPAPAEFLRRHTHGSLRRAFDGFKHRFTTGRDLADLLFGAKRAVEKHGSLGACFLAGLKPGDETVLPAMSALVRELTIQYRSDHFSLLPPPDRGSACKRLNLFLRWMVRHDDVDPGGWDSVSPAKLIVPLDVHMHRICRLLGLSSRRQADLRAALEVTSAFRTIVPDDPVRYDFCLTRPGIRWGATSSNVLEYCGTPVVV